MLYARIHFEKSSHRSKTLLVWERTKGVKGSIATVLHLLINLDTSMSVVGLYDISKHPVYSLLLVRIHGLFLGAKPSIQDYKCTI